MATQPTLDLKQMSTIDLNDVGTRAKNASRVLSAAPTETKRSALNGVADALGTHADEIVAANRMDMDAAKSNGLTTDLQDRLLLTQERLEGMAGDVRDVAALDDPIGEIISEHTRDDGLHIQRRRIPLGVIGLIYESRPDVTIDMTALCLMSGNAAVMRGGSESFHSNLALSTIARTAIVESGLAADAIQFIASTDRRYVEEMLRLDEYIDLLIPRGGVGLVRMVAKNATMPAITGGIGVCHTYVDEDADIDKAVEIVHNAKTQRPSVCNALDTILVHASIADTFLPIAAARLWSDGVELRGDRRTLTVLEPVAQQSGSPDLLQSANGQDFDTEFLGLRAAVRIVDSLDHAVQHISDHGSNHSEAIVSENKAVCDRFLMEVDASAVFANSSIRFNDGAMFGLGAEVAISTDKLQAYGPMGLKEITSSKWVVTGDGHIRT